MKKNHTRILDLFYAWSEQLICNPGSRWCTLLLIYLQPGNQIEAEVCQECQVTGSKWCKPLKNKPSTECPWDQRWLTGMEKLMKWAVHSRLVLRCIYLATIGRRGLVWPTFEKHVICVLLCAQDPPSSINIYCTSLYLLRCWCNSPQ